MFDILFVDWHDSTVILSPASLFYDPLEFATITILERYQAAVLETPAEATDKLPEKTDLHLPLP